MTITLGTVLAALAIVAGTWAAVSRLYGMLDKRLSIFEGVLSEHARTLVTHSVRMEKQDDVMGTLGGDLQRVIGRMEAWTDGHRMGGP